jgi:hypothetical protein
VFLVVLRHLLWREEKPKVVFGVFLVSVWERVFFLVLLPSPFPLLVED